MIESSEKRRIHCLPPCPAYDVEGMERWLMEMAARGWYLAEDGFFAGVATFEQGDVRKVKYRMEAAQINTGSSLTAIHRARSRSSSAPNTAGTMSVGAGSFTFTAASTRRRGS